MKKLSILINSLEGGGAERVTSLLLSELVNTFEVHLILFEKKIVYPIPKNVQVHTLLESGFSANGFVRILKLPIYAHKYKKLCKLHRIDVSLSLLDIPNWTTCLLKKSGWSVPVVISQRNYISDYINNFNYAIKSIYKLLVRHLFNSADLIIPNAQAMADDLVTNHSVLSSKIQTIYNPLDIDSILEKIKNQEKQAFDESKLHLLNMARLDSRKNQKLLLQALQRINSEEVHLHLLGRGDAEAQLKEMTYTYFLDQKVYFHGFQNNPVGYLKAADIFILSSNNEGFPNVILEALACQKVVLSTNCNSGPLELLSPYDENPQFNNEGFAVCRFGILIRVNDVNAMAAAIQYAQDNLQELKCTIASELTIDYIRQFDKRVIAKKFEDALRRAMLNE